MKLTIFKIHTQIHDEKNINQPFQHRQFFGYFFLNLRLLAGNIFQKLLLLHISEITHLLDFSYRWAEVHKAVHNFSEGLTISYPKNFVPPKKCMHHTIAK